MQYLEHQKFTSAREVMFSLVSVCPSVCLYVRLLTGLLKNTDQIFRKFYGVFGYNPETNRLDFE